MGGDETPYGGQPAGQPSISQRIQKTDMPIMVKMRHLQGGVEGVASLAQGVVYWMPPESAIKAAVAKATDPALSVYGADEGMPELTAALRHKLAAENGLTGYSVMVTAGANQAFTNIVLTLTDAHDRVALFCPYYFNALMTVQMTGGGANVVYGPCRPEDWHPDLDWLEQEMHGPQPPKLVMLVNPCNPSGVTLSRAELERASKICSDAGSWLLIDNTYEHFIWGQQEHLCVGGPHILHTFSFSKAYGMMGWRVGYIAYPDTDGQDFLGLQMVKVQDTVPICASLLSQHVALGALKLGRQWVLDNVATIRSNRELLLDALSPLGRLGSGVYGDGAIYLWARLPPGCEDDEAVVAWMVRRHRVAVIPGSACGCPGYFRAAFGKPAPDQYGEAAARLKQALQQLVKEGFAAVRAALPNPD
ncbi:hypothetical protein WJX72_009699 [[Myrmecia] bisecta]|uniref:Aminotransferase class I/classII large domain-containing protein n=1 Tax=[Myrmecia] bisecta TaxID=41462 RepID=A0AAW1PM15_9CHLO